MLKILEKENSWHYTTIKSISQLFRGIISTNHGDHYCRNCYHSFRTENKFKNHQRLCRNHDYCEVIMPEEGKNILKYTPEGRSLYIPHIIYADLDVVFRQIQPYQPNLKNCYTETKNVHIPSG